MGTENKNGVFGWAETNICVTNGRTSINTNGSISPYGASSAYTTIAPTQMTISIGGSSTGLATLPAKYKVEYIIEMLDGGMLEMREQKFITPREMVGLCKFINMVSASIHSGIKIMWSDLITELAIDRHFVSGKNRASYSDIHTQYVFLIDQK